MVPYWKRVPIVCPPVMLELDSTNMVWTNYPTPCPLVALNEDLTHKVREDPYDFYEDSLGG
jgi:hypothetical protein